MASAVKIEREGESVLMQMKLSLDEFRQLKGELDELFVIAREASKTPSRVSMRGKNEATKYFLIPRNFRKNLSLRGKVSCQRVDDCISSTFVYHVRKT